MERTRGLKATEDGLHVAWHHDVPESRFPWFWLRDHGHEAATLHPVTLQRQIFTEAIPDQTRAARESLAPDGQTVIVDWPDGARSESRRLPLEVPRSAPGDDARSPAGGALGCGHRRAAAAGARHAIMADARGLERWLEGVEIYGFCLAEGVPATPEDTAALARRIGYLRATIFGDFWDFTADLAKADTAYTNLELRPHTDGTYAFDAPGLQLFHCRHFAGSGGESILVDGFRIADELRAADPDAYETLGASR